MRLALKAIPVALLGVAAALLVACGNSNGLLSGNDASNLQNALGSVQSACANGQTARAALAAQRFSDRVDSLSPRLVDRRLIANLQQGARTLEQLASQTCTPTTTPSTSTTTTQATTAPTTTAPTTTAPTTPSTSSTPTTTTPSTPTSTAGTPPDQGGTPPGQGGTPPGQGGGGDAGGASAGGDGG
jgi:hypothetical protein